MKNINNHLVYDIGRAIFVARARCGFTQLQLAKKVGTAQPGIARLEGSTSLPSFSLVAKVADALDQRIVFRLEPNNPRDIRFLHHDGATKLNGLFFPNTGVVSPKQITANGSQVVFSSGFSSQTTLTSPSAALSQLVSMPY